MDTQIMQDFEIYQARGWQLDGALLIDSQDVEDAALSAGVPVWELDEYTGAIETVDQYGDVQVWLTTASRPWSNDAVYYRQPFEGGY